MIRAAKPDEMAMLCELMAKLHAIGPFVNQPLNIERKFKPLVFEAMRSGNMCIYMDDAGSGFIMGSIEPLCQVYDVKFATDVFFLPGRQPRGLADAFVNWAKGHKDVKFIRTSASAPGASQAYSDVGLMLEGGIYSMEIR